MPSADPSEALREHTLYVLRGGGAHMSFDDFILNFPAELCDQQIHNLPYTPWQVLEHMRIAQWDILEFSRDGKHVSPEWPTGYWPATDQRGSPLMWQRTVEKFHSDLKEMEALVADPTTDLFAKIPHGDGQTILREALLIADHNAYHLGTLVAMSRIIKG